MSDIIIFVDNGLHKYLKIGKFDHPLTVAESMSLKVNIFVRKFGLEDRNRIFTNNKNIWSCKKFLLSVKLLVLSLNIEDKLSIQR